MVGDDRRKVMDLHPKSAPAPRAGNTHTRFIVTAVSLRDGATVIAEATERNPYAAWSAVATKLFHVFGHVDYRVVCGAVLSVSKPSLAPSRPVAPSLGAGRWLW
jgi:hypothetical protein